MELSQLAGNRRIKDQLSLRQESRGLSHAYIICGPVGSGRHTLARLVSQAMLCEAPAAHRPCGSCGPCKKILRGIHPDVTMISGPGEGKSITVDQVRALRTDAYIRPNEGKRKVYWLEQADQMNASAQNAMLKLLEEGPAYASFLLIAGNEGGLLPTIRSRCEQLALAPVSPGECLMWLKGRYPQKPEEELNQAVRDCQGILGRAVERLEDNGSVPQRKSQAEELARALENGDELVVFQAAMALDKGGREEVTALLDALEAALGERIARGGDRRRLLKADELVKQLRGAAQLNANPGQLAGWLCAGMFVDP